MQLVYISSSAKSAHFTSVTHELSGCGLHEREHRKNELSVTALVYLVSATAFALQMSLAANQANTFDPHGV